MKDTPILVTGAAGFVGSHLIELLVKSGYTDILATDLKFSNPFVNEDFFKNLGVKFIRADLTEISTLPPVVKGRKWVFHPAALFSYSAGWKIMYKINAEGTKNLCEVAFKAGVDLFLHFSTCEVYGRASELPTSERAPARATHTYGRTKLEGERIALEYWKKKNLPVIVLRPTAIIGPRSTYGAIKPFILSSMGLLPFLIKGGTNIAHLVHVEDVVSAALFLAEKGGPFGEIYNIADDTPATFRDIQFKASEILRIPKPLFSAPIPRWLLEMIAPFTSLVAKIPYIDRLPYLGKQLAPVPLLEKDTVRVLYEDNMFDNTKIKQAGYKLKHPDLFEYLPTVLNWYRENRII